MKNLAKYIHEACIDAVNKCPQYVEPDDDDLVYLDDYSRVEFGKLPKKGIVDVIRYWKSDPTLMDSEYIDALPEDVIQLFDRIDELMNDAIKQAAREI